MLLCHEPYGYNNNTSWYLQKQELFFYFWVVSSLLFGRKYSVITFCENLKYENLKSCDI